MPRCKRRLRYGPVDEGQAVWAWQWRRYLVGYLWDMFAWEDLIDWPLLGRPRIRRR